MELMSEDERPEPEEEKSSARITFHGPAGPPMAESYRDAKFKAWVSEVDARYLERQYVARHINRA